MIFFPHGKAQINLLTIRQWKLRISSFFQLRRTLLFICRGRIDLLYIFSLIRFTKKQSDLSWKHKMVVSLSFPFSKQHSLARVWFPEIGASLWLREMIEPYAKYLPWGPSPASNKPSLGPLSVVLSPWQPARLRLTRWAFFCLSVCPPFTQMILVPKIKKRE